MNSMTRTIAPACAVDLNGMAVIGMTRHALMGIRHAEDTGGAAPAAAPAASPTQTALGAPTAPAPAATGTPATQTPTGGAQTPQTGAQPAAGAAETPPAINPATGQPYTAAETQKFIADLRGENKTHREAAATEKARADAEAGKLSAVLAALGLNADGSAAAKTPDQLTAELNERNTAVETTKRENLVLRVAGKAEISADADKMLDSRAFNDKLSALPSADKDSVETLVKEWVQEHPDHKTIPAAASSGGVAHAGGVPTTQRKTLSEALDAALPTPTKRK